MCVSLLSSYGVLYSFFFFFFQAEDGIRDLTVTGVQTCALPILVVLEQQGSFTSAAARLGVSKAAMSQRVAELERAAGVALVTRTTRSVRLTEAGQRLVDETRGAFEHIADSFAGVRDLAAEPRGLLRVTAPVAFSRQQLMPRLPAFLRAHPQIRLERSEEHT